MTYTRRHDEIEAELARLPDDATVLISAGRLRSLVREAQGIEEAVTTDWMEAIDPCLIG